ncbi:MAG: S-layer homology domain-containing protein [Anaerotignum sp.]|nr:S-layer homology domain-containing protein [Anaerotignum sp.]
MADEATKTAIGDKPLIQLTFAVDGKQISWNNANAPVTVSIPYTPTAAELGNPENIIIWYIDGSGKAISVPNGHYGLATGRVTFATTHFSYYAVGYNKVSFKDVPESAWFHKAVNYIAARGITTDTGNSNFTPQTRLTRGEFLVMLMKAYTIAPDEERVNNFVDAGSIYYTSYLAATKRLGISGGIGNNMFAPDKEITRQEMFTLLYNALKVINKLPQGNFGKSISSFSDAEQISVWAKDAMTLLLETGTVGGNDGKLAPTSATTRGEMAQVLYNLLSK